MTLSTSLIFEYLIIYRHKADVNIKCPIEKGEHTVTATYALSSEIPRGKPSPFQNDTSPLPILDLFQPSFSSQSWATLSTRMPWLAPP